MSFLAAKNQLEIVKGESRVLDLAVTIPGTSDPYSLSSAVLYFGVKLDVEDDKPLILKISTDASQISVVDAARGTAKIYLLPEDTYNLDTGNYLYDSWLVDGADRIQIVENTRFSVTSPVLRIPL